MSIYLPIVSASACVTDADQKELETRSPSVLNEVAN
jgi:hypothetical protein